MKKFTAYEFRKLVAAMILDETLDVDTDNEGQCIFYTGFYVNVDGDVQDEPDPKWDGIVTNL